MYGYVIFTDIEKYSTLKDADLKIYFNKVIPVISEQLKEYKDAAIIWNTWGDAIFAIYDKAEMAINMALAYRESFSKINFEEFGIRKLNPRIAGNFGEFELIFDPVSGKQNVHGTLVNITARIEPVTTPGEIFVTKEFKDMSISSYDKVENVRFEDMGEIKLPKNAGQLNLYRLCKRAETAMKPAGLLISNINYNIQAPIKTRLNEPKVKPVEKTIEQRLLENSKLLESSNKKVSSEDKLSKIATVLKDDKTLIKKTKGPNFIKTLFNGLKSPKDLFKLKENPFLLAIVAFIIAITLNIILNMAFIQYKQNIPMLTPEAIAFISLWLWPIGYLTSSFITGQAITFLEKRRMKIKNIIIAPILIVFLYLFSCVLQNNSASANPLFYINILILWFVCFVGFSKGTEVAGDKIKTSTRR